MSWRVSFLVPWILGFVLVFNPYLLPPLGLSPRATDMLGAVLIFWLLWRFSTKGLHAKPLAALLIVGTVPFFWGVAASLIGDLSTVVISARWLLAIPYAFVLFYVVQNPQERRAMIWGLWWGCVANAGVLLLQFYGLEQLTKDLGLAAQDSSESGSARGDRSPGMHGHPNGSTAVVSLIVPISLYLYYVGKTRAWTIIAGLGVLALATQITLTRSSMLTSLLTLMIVFIVFSVVRLNLKRSLPLIALLALIMLPAVYWLGPPGGAERWQDPNSNEVNLEGRYRTNEAALRTSAESPLGLGVEAGEEKVTSKTGLKSTHNAFLQVAVVYGPLVAGLLALLMLFIALQVLRSSRTVWMLEAMLALHLFGLFFWEEHFNNATFIILTNWLVAASAASIVVTRQQGRPDLVRPIPRLERSG